MPSRNEVLISKRRKQLRGCTEGKRSGKKRPSCCGVSEFLAYRGENARPIAYAMMLSNS
jgi:hypothetical protein